MTHRFFLAAGIVGAVVLAGCGGGGGAGTVANSVPVVQSVARSADAAVEAPSLFAVAPLVIHVGFTHAALAKSKYGPLAFYAPNTGATKIIYVKAGKKVAFVNDDRSSHTASGLGSTSFPTSFDNTSGLKAVGKGINGGLTWSTGTLGPGGTSQTFTVGPKGVYYFGCYYHYAITPSMRDVIVSQ